MISAMTLPWPINMCSAMYVKSNGHCVLKFLCPCMLFFSTLLGLPGFHPFLWILGHTRESLPLSPLTSISNLWTLLTYIHIHSPLIDPHIRILKKQSSTCRNLRLTMIYQLYPIILDILTNSIQERATKVTTFLLKKNITFVFIS